MTEETTGQERSAKRLESLRAWQQKTYGPIPYSQTPNERSRSERKSAKFADKLVVRSNNIESVKQNRKRKSGQATAL